MKFLVDLSDMSRLQSTAKSCELAAAKGTECSVHRTNRASYESFGWDRLLAYATVPRVYSEWQRFQPKCLSAFVEKTIEIFGPAPLHSLKPASFSIFSRLPFHILVMIMDFGPLIFNDMCNRDTCASKLLYAAKSVSLFPGDTHAGCFPRNALARNSRSTSKRLFHGTISPAVVHCVGKERFEVMRENPRHTHVEVAVESMCPDARPTFVFGKWVRSVALSGELSRGSAVFEDPNAITRVTTSLAVRDLSHFGSLRHLFVRTFTDSSTTPFIFPGTLRSISLNDLKGYDSEQLLERIAMCCPVLEILGTLPLAVFYMYSSWFSTKFEKLPSTLKLVKCMIDNTGQINSDFIIRCADNMRDGLMCVFSARLSALPGATSKKIRRAFWPMKPCVELSIDPEGSHVYAFAVKALERGEFNPYRKNRKAIPFPPSEDQLTLIDRTSLIARGEQKRNTYSNPNNVVFRVHSTYVIKSA